MTTHWKFDDEENTACFTSVSVLNGAPILRVFHDFDGDWLFHNTSLVDTDSAKIVGLGDMVRRDPSLDDLHDLPYGWRAERTGRSAPWERFKDHPYATFEENGYYLEDALWLSEFLPDIDPPPEEMRENLQVDSHVKLVFRFAAEDSARGDNQCERLWVQVEGYDDDADCFTGSIANDPHHDTVKYGDPVSFHPSHVADIEE